MFPRTLDLELNAASAPAPTQPRRVALRARIAERAWDAVDLAAAVLTLRDDYDADWDLPAEFGRPSDAARGRSCQGRPRRPPPAACPDAHRTAGRAAGERAC